MTIHGVEPSLTLDASVREICAHAPVDPVRAFFGS
jgi:hypothetical protein